MTVKSIDKAIESILRDAGRPDRLQLIRLHLTNFKGCKELTIEASGRDLAIYGDNATGKTTVADAFYWLFFGKDSQGRADFEIKTLDEDGRAIHNNDHAVEAVLGLPSGETLTLKKLYKEKWTKSRGSASAEFSGHTTDHWVNGVPVQEKDYKAQVAAIIDEQRFRLLTDPMAFNALHWQERRKTLLEVCGDISDADVIAATPKLAELPGILGRHTLDDYRKILSARRREINEQLQILPAKISTLRDGLPDPADVIPDPAPLQAELRQLEEQRARITAGGEIAEKTKRLREIESEIIEIENNLRKSLNAVKAEAEARLLAKRREHSEAVAEVERLNAQIASAAASSDALGDKLARLREEGHALQALKFEFTAADTCAACGQSLPADRVAEARRKAEEEFNANKSRRLEANIAEGKAIRAQSDALVSQVKSLKLELATAEQAAESLRIEGVELKRLADAVGVQPLDVASDERWAAAAKEQDRLKAEIEDLRANNAEILCGIDEAAAELQRQLIDIANAKARVDVRNENLARIAQLESEEKALAEEIERIERETYLCEEFIRAKVSLLTDRINAKFSIARFRLFELQVNGGINEVCETTFDGVPFSSLNHGARLNVGLDIINTLAEHSEIAPPIFIDNAESVTSIIATHGQQIKLIVSESDKQLRIEAA